MLLTLWCVFVTLGSLFFFGLPVTEWLSDPDSGDASLWIVAPFVGLGIIILPLHTLVYLNIPISTSTLGIWILGVLLWFSLFITGRLTRVWSNVPHPVLFAALSVYLLQGVGLFLIGARYYVARAWIDQFNYTAIAQFLTDYVFSTTYVDIHNQPYLATAIALKLDRIGVSIFQGFLGVSTFTDAKTVFESAILVSPVMTALALYQVARRLALPPRFTAFVAVGAGVLPAITSVHVETFFSQALGIPYLFILPTLMFDWINQPTWKRLVIVSVILATGVSAYTEFHLIFVGTLALMLGFQIWREHLKFTYYVRAFFLLNGIALTLNPGYLYTLYAILQRVAWSNILANIYPWAYTLEGLGRLWLGDAVFLARVTPWLGVIYDALSIILIVMGYLGLGLMLRKRQNTIALSMFVLAVLPLGIRASNQFPYQFYKLLLSISPLLLLGIAVLFSELEITHTKNAILRNGINLSMLGLVLLFCAGTFGTTAIAGIFPVVGRSIGASRLLAPGARQAQDRLSEIRGQNILIVDNESFMNAWLGYFARHNRVWIANPKMSDTSVAKIQTFQDLPDDIWVLTTSADVGANTDSAIQPIWSAEPYQLGKISNKDWIVITAIKNANGIEEWNGDRGLWLGDGDTEINFVSSKEGRATITAEFTRGPSLPNTLERQLLVLADSGYSAGVTIARDGAQSFSVPVIAGPNRLILRPLDRPTLPELSNGDARPLLLGVRGLHINLSDSNQ
ncbi:MAG: hypothetical protein HY868_18350 [Chloroflexi bacterium]|nr:hypothetical protein [Chloroflexota bacterium]